METLGGYEDPPNRKSHLGIIKKQPIEKRNRAVKCPEDRMQPSFPFSEMKTELTTRGVSFSGKGEENGNNNETACEWLNVSRGVQYTTLAEVPKQPSVCSKYPSYS